MQPDTSLKIDVTRIVASFFWIGGALLTLLVALETFRKDKDALINDKSNIKCEIEKMEKQFHMQCERLKNKI